MRTRRVRSLGCPRGLRPVPSASRLQFGDQNFKSAIALIELHKVRFGNYPNTLADLKFLGSWDQNWLFGVEYRKLDEGYELNVTRGWIGRPRSPFVVPLFDARRD